MSSRIYVIKAEPTKLPSVHRLTAAGDLLPLGSDIALPAKVLQHALWLSALAACGPMPSSPAPPVVIAPARPGDAYIAMVSIEEDGGA